MPYVVYIEVGEATPGVWCPACLLPSAFQMPVYQMCGHGCTLLFTLLTCPDCGWEQHIGAG